MKANSKCSGRLPAALLFALLATGCGKPADEATLPAAQGSAVEKADDTSGSEDSARDVVGRNVTTDSLAYGEVGEQLVYGHFAFPEDMVDPLPAILVIHDRWGLNREIVEFGSRLAGEGYIVLAIDLFGGSTASEPSGARDLELRVVEEPDLALANVRQAYRFVRDVAGAPSVAVLGFGFGGGWALNAAIAQPKDFAAVVNYYGQVNSDQDLLAPIAGPILGLFAGDDRAVPVDSVRAFERELEALDKDFDIVVYDDARRGFADTLMVDAYDQDIAARAWQQTLEFLRAGFSRPAM